MAPQVDDIRRLENFIKIIRDITSKLDSIQANHLIVKAGRDLTDADFCNIGVIKNNKMYFYPPIEESCARNIDEGIMGYVVKTGKPRLVPDVTKDEYYKKCDEKTRSELAVPIKYNDTCIGVLNVESTKLEAFNKSDCEVLMALADFAASAINNARHHEELEILREIDQKITSSLDLIETLNLIKEKASELINTKDIRIRLLDGSKLIPVIGVEQDQISAATWEVGECIVGKAAETKKAILENDVQNNPFFREALSHIVDEKRREDLLKINSEIAIPLLIQDNVIGVLNAHSPKLEAYTKDDCKLLQALADQASIAIENARLYKDLEKQIEILEELSKIGTHIINLDLEKVLRGITKGLHEIIKVDIPMIYLLDDKKDNYEIVYGDIRKDWESECHPRPNGVGSLAINKSKVIIINEPPNNNGENGHLAINPFPRQKGVKTTIAIPLLSGDQDQLYRDYKKIAVMYLHFLGEKYDLKSGQIEKLKPTITKIINIVKSETVYNGLCDDELEKVRDSIAQKFHEQKINEEICEIINADIILVYKFNEERNVFDNLCYSSLGLSWKHHSNPRRKIGSGYIAMQTRKPAIAYEDTTPDINPIPKMKGVKTTVAVPLIFNDKILGVMYLHFLAKKRTFSKEEMKAIETFGANAAIAIEKANSYEDLKELYEIGRFINTNIKLEDVVLDIGLSAKRLEPNAVFHVFLYDDKANSWDYLPTTGEVNSIEAILATHKPRAKGVGYKVISTREPEIIENLETSEIADPIAIEHGIKATAAFPLEVGDRLIGVLYFHFFETKAFSDDDILRLSMFTSKVAIAINNALKYANLEKIIREINKLRGADKINENLSIMPEGLVDKIKICGLKASPKATGRR